MTTVKGIHCGTYQRVTYELFGFDRGQWLRVKEYDEERECKDAFNSPTLRAAYKGNVAWCERTVVETRILNGANVPVYQLVMQMRGEDGEAGDVLKSEYQDLTLALQMTNEARDMADCVSATLVDLSTGRSVEKS